MLRKRVAVAILFGVVVVAGSRSLRSAPGVDAQALQESWRSAIVAANMGALDAQYADGLVYVHSDARIQTKEQFLAPFRAGTLRFTSLTGCDAPRIHVYEAAAVVSACYELKAGTGPPSRHLFMTTWVNDGGRWRIAAQQTTRLLDKP